MVMHLNTIAHMDALEFVRNLPDECVDCCVTSPPYFGLRDYDVAGQIGLEPTPQAYVLTLVTLFREVKRVLKDSGTFWLNLGDSYAGNNSSNGEGEKRNLSTAKFHGGTSHLNQRRVIADCQLPQKNLLLIPHRVAIALQDDGWICRQDNVWHKPNPMPESVTDRTTRAHEYVFQFAKSGKYYYDAEAIKEPASGNNRIGFRGGEGRPYVHDNTFNNSLKIERPVKNLSVPGRTTHSMHSERANGNDYTVAAENRNKRSVWTIPPAQFREAHFATFPLELPEICIKAGCPPGGLVLDPFMGSGTTALVARSLSRNFIGSELNAEYIEIAEKRLALPYTPDMFIMQELKDYQS